MQPSQMLQNSTSKNLYNEKCVFYNWMKNGINIDHMSIIEQALFSDIIYMYNNMQYIYIHIGYQQDNLDRR